MDSREGLVGLQSVRERGDRSLNLIEFVLSHPIDQLEWNLFSKLRYPKDKHVGSVFTSKTSSLFYHILFRTNPIYSMRVVSSETGIQVKSSVEMQ